MFTFLLRTRSVVDGKLVAAVIDGNVCRCRVVRVVLFATDVCDVVVQVFVVCIVIGPCTLAIVSSARITMVMRHCKSNVGRADHYCERNAKKNAADAL